MTEYSADSRIGTSVLFTLAHSRCFNVSVEWKFSGFPVVVGKLWWSNNTSHLFVFTITII